MTLDTEDQGTTKSRDVDGSKRNSKSGTSLDNKGAGLSKNGNNGTGISNNDRD